jgi:hypothetical protein
MKSGMGVGEMQCWNRRSAVVSVQWSVCAYAVLLLAGYRAWGLFGEPSTPARWWGGACRWSLNTVWRGYRTALWGTSEFGPLGRHPATSGRKKSAIWQGYGTLWLVQPVPSVPKRL